MSELEAEIERDVAAALAEDIGSGDLTAALISPERIARATLVSRNSGVLCGSPWFAHCFRKLHPDVAISWKVNEGEALSAESAICEVIGDARAILTAERTALNFLQTLSATATATRAFVDAIRGTHAVIVDTRKTIPGLRAAQKYAVRIGGGKNHRMGLYDAILIKENHIAASRGIADVLARANASRVPVQIEVETLAQLVEALNAGAKLVLLDNFDIPSLWDAVRINSNRAELEASGGITLANVREIAETGVDRISVGSLTKNIAAVDLSLRIRLKRQG
jgi:nicotinate-nucleotide pyrophosphorylase (carboxylating)